MIFLKKLLAPPIFDDETKTREANLLNFILWGLVIAPIPYVLYILIKEPEFVSRTIAQIVFGETVNIFLLWFMHRGKVRATSALQVFLLWLFFTVTAFTGEGVNGKAYLLGYPLVIFIAGSLLGTRGALIATCATLASGGTMVFAQTQQWVEVIPITTSISTWLITIAIFPMFALLQYVTGYELRNALSRANTSEERYRLISQVSSDYTFSTEVDSEGTMRLNWVAGAFENITGYTFDEYVASGGWLAHLDPHDVEQDVRDSETLKTNKPVVTEVRTFKKNGDLSWVRVYAHPVWDEKQNRLAGIAGGVKDITLRKQTEEALTRERDLLQMFMDNIPDLVYLKDTASRFIRINMAHAKFLKVNSPEDVIGKTDLDFQPPDLARQFLEEEKQLLELGQPIVNRVEFNPLEDGTPRWLAATKVPVKDSSGRVTGIIGITRDITEQKLAEQLEGKRRETLEKVLALGKHVAEVSDLKTTLDRLWHAVVDDLGFDRFGIFFYNAKRNSMDRMLGTDKHGKMENFPDIWFPVDEQSTFKRVLDKPDGLYLTNNFDIDNNIPEGHGMYGVKSYAAVAVWAGNKPVAVISVDQFITQRPITLQQIEALRLFAGYAGLAIENSRLNEAIQNELTEQKQSEEKEQRRRIMMEKVVELGKRVTVVSDFRTTLRNIWHGVRYDLDFDRVGLFLYNAQENTMDGAYGTDRAGNIWDAWHVKIGLGDNPRIKDAIVFHKVLDRPDGFYFTKDYEAEFNLPPDHDMAGVKYYAVVAVWAGNKPVAIISVDQLVTGRAFSDEQLEALRLFAGYAGLAISNAYLNDALEAELEQKKNFINELEAKNAELERFTYTVSHDLKSPLVTITGFLGYLEKDALTGNKEKIKGSVNRISRAAEKMQDLLNDLLELSRIGRLMNPPENILFEEIVTEAKDHVQGQLDEKNVLLKIQNDLPIIRGDRVRLVEVMQNLIDNAAKYSNPNTQPIIEIGTEEDPQNNTVYFVRDNGIGIEPQFHERVFGLFNKLNPHSEGTGIGLSLVKRIIEVHNGRIWVESEAGKGATFYFTLPKT